MRKKKSSLEKGISECRWEKQCREAVPDLRRALGEAGG